jgi:hypothetical protein
MSDSVHTLTKAHTVAAVGQADNPLTLTFLNDSSMSPTASAACEGVYFSMPALAGVIATRGAGTVSTSPTTDRWTS